jgi:hypothetical protein
MRCKYIVFWGGYKAFPEDKPVKKISLYTMLFVKATVTDVFPTVALFL